MALKIKNEHQDTYVAFGKGNKPLGQRSDIYLLARLGLDINSQLLQYFEGEVTEEDINEAEHQYFILEQERKNQLEHHNQQLAEKNKVRGRKQN